MVEISIKRVYESPEKDDGRRILVDRVWPRGVSKEDAELDHWCRDVAPSDELRQWFDHDPERFEEFAERYVEELEDNDEATGELLEAVEGADKVTLLFGARDEQHNQAVVLRDWLRRHVDEGDG